MKKTITIIFISSLLLVGLDQLTKKYFESLLESESITIIKGFFKLNLSYNDGAAWGILSGNMGVFFVITIIAFGLFYYLIKDADFKSNKFYSIAVILLISGAIGNFIDRLLYGEVIDFLDFIIFGYDFPIFNIADICLVVGMIMFAIDVLKEDVFYARIKSNKSD